MDAARQQSMQRITTSCSTSLLILRSPFGLDSLCLAAMASSFRFLGAGFSESACDSCSGSDRVAFESSTASDVSCGSASSTVRKRQRPGQLHRTNHLARLQTQLFSCTFGILFRQKPLFSFLLRVWQAKAIYRGNDGSERN